jgi:FAD/FMN-containing dehydrogenase
VGSSQIGGNLSTNAGGNNAVRYGTARDQVLGLEVVLPDGSLWNGMRALRKNTAGYDLRQFFIGAEGTLGIITGAVLKLRPNPKNRVSGFLGVEGPEQALALLGLMQSYLGETVSVFEFMSAEALDFALAAEGTRYPLENRAPWCLLIEAETAAIGFDLQGGFEQGLTEAFAQDLVLDGVIAQSEAQRDSFWHLRESIAHVMVEDTSCLKSDTAVPVGQVPAYMKAARAAVEAAVPGARQTPFGHLGDGNVHFNIVRPVEMGKAEFRALWPRLSGVLDAVSIKFGGTISAEHGIGRLKVQELSTFADPTGYNAMRAIKQALDPDGRMNPGVLFPLPKAD